MYAVKLGTQLDITIIGKKPEQSFLDFCYENIGCQCVEKVNARYLKEPFVLMIDGEGRLKDKSAINFIASYLYGTHEHRTPIVGDAIVVILDRQRHDLFCLNIEQAWQVADSMNKIAMLAFKKVRSALGDMIISE